MNGKKPLGIYSSLCRISRSNVFFAALSFLIPIAFLVSKVRFRFGNLSVPLNMSYDEIFYANESDSFIQNLNLQNNSFGFPGKQELIYTFIAGDSIPIFIASLISRLRDNPFFGLNVYYMLSVGLIGLAFFASARILAANNFFAFVFSLFVSISHHNLAWTTQAPTFGSYFLVPILFSVLIVKIREETTRPRILESRILWISWSIFLVFYGAFFSYFTLYSLLLIGSFLIFSIISRGSAFFLKLLRRDIFLILSGFILMAIPSLIAALNTVGSINYFKERNPTAAFINSGTPFQTLFPTDGSITWRMLDFLGIPWSSSFYSLKNQIQTRGIFDGGWSESIDVFLILFVLILLFTRARNITAIQK